MTDTALARRAVACKHWRWSWGMLTQYGRLIHSGTILLKDGKPWTWMPGALTWDQPRPDALPDLTDPATLGCLLALVREAWGEKDSYLYPGAGSSEWGSLEWWCLAGSRDWYGPTEAEALVAALEAAP